MIIKQSRGFFFYRSNIYSERKNVLFMNSTESLVLSLAYNMEKVTSKDLLCSSFKFCKFIKRVLHNGNLNTLREE